MKSKYSLKIHFSFPNNLVNFLFHSDNSIGNDVIIPIEVETLLITSNRDASLLSTPVSNDASESIESTSVSEPFEPSSTGHMENNLAMQQPSLVVVDNAKEARSDEKDIMLEWHRNKPSIWQQYYGSKRLKYSNMVKKIKGKFDVNTAVMSYVSVKIAFFYICLSLIIREQGRKISRH